MQLLNIEDACIYTHVSADTLGRYEKKGLINPLCTPGNHR